MLTYGLKPLTVVVYKILKRKESGCFAEVWYLMLMIIVHKIFLAMLKIRSAFV